AYEIADDSQTCGAGFLGVELYAGDVGGLKDGGVRDLVGARGGGPLVGGDVVAVGKVDQRARGHVVQEVRLGAAFEFVPAHVRDARAAGEAADDAGKDAEAADFGGFFAGFVESLQAEADAEEWDAGTDAADERVADVEAV